MTDFPAMIVSNATTFGPPSSPSSSSPNMMKAAPYVKFMIRNTVRILSEEEAENRVGVVDGIERAHFCDWHVYMDILEGDPKILLRVEVDMGPNFARQRHYVWNRPIQVVVVRRRTATTMGPTATTGPTPFFFGVVSRPVKSVGGGRALSASDLSASAGRSYLEPLALPRDVGYCMTTQESIVVAETTSTSGGQELSFPTKAHFYYGDKGIQASIAELAASTSWMSLNLCITTKFNCADGFDGLLKLCQNFVKYEQAIAYIERINTGTKRGHADNAAKSNRDEIEGATNKSKHANLAACTSITELVMKMNPDPNTRYKLHLLQLEPKVISAEFHVTSTMTADRDLLEAWIRFYVFFVHNSLRLRQPKPMKQSRSLPEQRELLFAHVVRDRFVEEIILNVAESDSAASVLSFQMPLSDLDGGDDDTLSLSETIMQTELPSLTPSLPQSLQRDESYWSFSSDMELRDRKRQRLEEKETPAECPAMSPSPTSVCLDNFHHCSTYPPKAATLSLAPRTTTFKSMLRSFAAKNITCNQLNCILKKLNASRRNRNKGLLVQELRGYFDARSAELLAFFNHDEARQAIQQDLPSGQILGIEILLDKECGTEDADAGDVHEEQTNSDMITIIIRGGKQKLVRPRTNVCTPGSHPTSTYDLDLKHLTDICKKLQLCDGTKSVNPENAAALFDSYLDRLQGVQHSSNDQRCHFAIAHNLLHDLL